MSKAPPQPASRMIPLAFALGALAGALAAPGNATAQDRPAESPALEQHHPDLHALLDRIHLAHSILYERLATDVPDVEVPAAEGDQGGGDAGPEGSGDTPAASIDAELYQELADLLGAGRGRTATTNGPLPSRVGEIIRRTGSLHRRILNAYADPEVADPGAKAEAAIDDYLGEPELALPPEPKEMSLMHEHPYATAFRRTYPRLSGLVRASQWLQFAAYDPFFLRPTAEAQAAGVGTVVGRLASKLENPPEAFPTEVPMAPTIAPSLLHWHPRAAAIFDNLNMMHEVIADLLVHPDVADKRAAIERVVGQFTDPEYRLADTSDWLRMALRHGIYNQGGPALGTLTRSERNVEHGDHAHGDHMVLPGMGPPAN